MVYHQKDKYNLTIHSIHEHSVHNTSDDVIYSRNITETNVIVDIDDNYPKESYSTKKRMKNLLHSIHNYDEKPFAGDEEYDKIQSIIINDFKNNTFIVINLIDQSECFKHNLDRNISIVSTDLIY